MSVVAEAKELTRDLGKGVEVIGKKVSDVFDKVASHLPFSNFAKKEAGDFHLEVDLPGVKKEEINLEIEDDILIVSAVRHFKNELSRDDYYRCESTFGKMERRFRLPEYVDTEKVSASHEDGRLTITLHKLEKAKPRAISIK